MSFCVCINRPVYVVYLLYVVYKNANNGVHLLCIMGMIIVFITFGFAFKYIIKLWKKSNIEISNKYNVITRCNLIETYTEPLRTHAQRVSITLECGRVNSGQFGSKVWRWLNGAQ